MGTTGRTRHVPPPTFDLIEDECTLNAAAAREVSRELDVLNFSPSPSPMTQTDSCDSVRAHPAADVAAAVLVRAPAQVTAIEAVLASAATKAVLASADAVLPACMTIASKEKEAAGCSRPILHRRRPIGRPSPHHPSHPLLVYASRLHSLFPGAGYRPHNEDQDAAPSPAVSAVVSAGGASAPSLALLSSRCSKTPRPRNLDSQRVPASPPHSPLAHPRLADRPHTYGPASCAYKQERRIHNRDRRKHTLSASHLPTHRTASQPPLIPSLAPFTRKQTPDTVPVQQSNTSASAPGSTVSQSPAQLAPSAPGHHTTPLWTISPAPLVADGSPLPVAP
ncbi:hypothetical protein K438DRAFT_1995627 [Mycena galopus ATCC 62051]|nr:hypothetical protein K438DRAFT_1995627 [Mycena galopus ATCC 62051]